MNEEYAKQDVLIPDAVYVVAATVLSAIGIVGFISNACVIFIMLREPQVIFLEKRYYFMNKSKFTSLYQDNR